MSKDTITCTECGVTRQAHVDNRTCSCNGTGKHSPVDKIPVCPKCESINQCQYCGHCTKCCSTQIDKLEAENDTLKTEAMRLKGRVGGLTRSNKKYKAEIERLEDELEAILIEKAGASI